MVQYFYGRKVEVFIQFAITNLIESPFRFYSGCLQGLTQQKVEKLIIEILSASQQTKCRESISQTFKDCKRCTSTEQVNYIYTIL